MSGASNGRMQATIERLKVEDWDRTIDVNIKSVFYGIGAALPHMKGQKREKPCSTGSSGL